MKEAFCNMYSHGFISIGGLRQAVIDNTITKEDYEEITGEAYGTE